MKVHHNSTIDQWSNNRLQLRGRRPHLRLAGLAEADGQDISQGSVTMYLANGTPVQVPTNFGYDGAFYNGQTVWTYAHVQATIQANQIAAQVAQQQAAAAAAAQAAAQVAAQVAAQQAAQTAAAAAKAAADAAAAAAAQRQRDAQAAAQAAAALQAQQASAAAIAQAKAAAAAATAAANAAIAKANQTASDALNAHNSAVSQGATVPVYSAPDASGGTVVAGGSGGDLINTLHPTSGGVGVTVQAPNKAALYALLAVGALLVLRR